MSTELQPADAARPKAPAAYGRWPILVASAAMAVAMFLPVGFAEDGSPRFRWDSPHMELQIEIAGQPRDPAVWTMALFVYAPGLAAACGVLSLLYDPWHRSDWIGAGGAAGLVTTLLPLPGSLADDVPLFIAAVAGIVAAMSASLLGGAVLLVRRQPRAGSLRVGIAGLGVLCLAAEGVIALVLAQRPADAPPAWPAEADWAGWAIVATYNLAVLGAMAPALLRGRGVRVYWIPRLGLPALAAALLAAQWQLAADPWWLCHVPVVLIGSGMLLALGLPMSAVLKPPRAAYRPPAA